MDDRYGMQGRCLQDSKEPSFMRIYDDFDPAARKRLRNSHYDLCTACVYDIAVKIREKRIAFDLSSDFICEAIDQMELQIRCEEAPQAQ